MARFKNALRGHFIGTYDPEAPTVEPTDWLEVAKWITDISDDTQEETEETAYYDGDGTPESEVTSVAGAYSFEGTHDPEDPAQALIAGLKYKTGDGRKVWHKVVSADEAEQTVGVATVTAIVAGSGPAGEYEAFSCNIRYDQTPEISPVTPEG